MQCLRSGGVGIVTLGLELGRAHFEVEMEFITHVVTHLAPRARRKLEQSSNPAHASTV